MLNKVILMGRLTADPEHKQTASGVSVTSFSLAVERSFSGKGKERETDFITIVAWRQTADFICKYFAKGRMVALEGSIQTRRYEDRNGNKRTAVEVVAEHVYFTGEKKESVDLSSFNPDDFEEIDSGGDEDLPF